MKFTKMHGIGNDYIYINCLENEIKNPAKVARILSDRHFGIGADGLVLILPSDNADFMMRILNSDGSEAEMCGNAIRCVGKYLFDNKITNKTQLNINTLSGLKTLDMIIVNNEVELVKVDMGEPIIDSTRIPVLTEKEQFVNESVDIEGTAYKVTCVSMGNPHAIIYTDKVDFFPVDFWGPKIETNKIFPNRTNVEFVQTIDRKNFKMRVWERGAGETLACGTGACAALVASVLNNVCDRKAIVSLRGGELIIEWDEATNHVFMTGPAVTVFEGEIEIKGED